MFPWPGGRSRSRSGIKTLALDISTTAIGWAVNGEVLEFGEEKSPYTKDDSEGDRLHWVYMIAMGLQIAHGCQRIVIEESNSSMNMHTTRLLLGARGVLIHMFHTLNLPVELISVSRVRSLTGVSTGMKKGTSKYMRRKTVKQRAIERARELGAEVTTDNEADAVLLLMAAQDE